MNDINIFNNGFDLEIIDADNYTISLLERAATLGIITWETADSIKIGITEILSESILLYSNGRSTSVHNETAIKLLSSILYNTDAGLRLYGRHSLALDNLLKKKISDIYYEGLAATEKARKQASLLLLMLKKTKCEGMSREYDRFISSEAGMYIRKYDCKFNSSEKLYVNIPEIKRKKILKGIYGVIDFMKEMFEFGIRFKSDNL